MRYCLNAEFLKNSAVTTAEVLLLTELPGFYYSSIGCQGGGGSGMRTLGLASTTVREPPHVRHAATSTDQRVDGPVYICSGARTWKQGAPMLSATPGKALPMLPGPTEYISLNKYFYANAI